MAASLVRSVSTTLDEVQRDIVRREQLREGIRVRILHKSGRKARGDMSGLPSYNVLFARRSDNDTALAEWRRNRFNRVYGPFGLEVELLDEQGTPIHGATKMDSLRQPRRARRAS